MIFTEVLAALAVLPDARMAEPWTWPGHAGGPLEVRDVHWRCVEAEQAALVEAPAPATEAEAILAGAQAAWGDFRGLLAGLPDAVLDADAGDGGWTLRQVVAHTLLTERRYRLQTAYAAQRTDADPLRIASPEALEHGEDVGGVVALLDRMDLERAQSDEELRRLDATALLRPTQWVNYDVDVHFRLHRFAAHIAEHTIHAEKVLRALGQPPAEARQIVRRLSMLRGAHERRTPPDVLARLDADHAALVASIG